MGGRKKLCEQWEAHKQGLKPAALPACLCCRPRPLKRQRGWWHVHLKRGRTAAAGAGAQRSCV